MRYWRSTVCEKTEPIGPLQSDHGEYSVGDSEPCTCGDLQCAAVVEQGTPVVDVIGCSPPHAYE